MYKSITSNVISIFISLLFVTSQIVSAAPPPGKGKPDKGGGTEPTEFDPQCDTAAGQIGFTGTLKSFSGTPGNDYLIFRLQSDQWGTTYNYIKDVKLHAFRPTTDSSSARNIVFGGQPSNTFSTGGIELSYDGFQLPMNSLALVTVQTGTNTSGDNVPFDVGWLGEEWLLCGTLSSSPKYETWETATTTYTGAIGSGRVAALGSGVNVMGGEYACAQGWGFHHHSAVGVSHTELRDMLVKWGADTVRLPMNEHCWVSQLGATNPEYSNPNNGKFWFQYIQDGNDANTRRKKFRAELLKSPENYYRDKTNYEYPDSSGHVYGGIEAPKYSVCDGGGSTAKCSTQGAGYRASFKDLVRILTSAEINVVLDLHWTDSNGLSANPGTALDLTVLPGQISRTFWKSVAATVGFKDNSRVLFNLFNEPRGIPQDAGLWVQWRDGNGSNYVGMQDLVDDVRSTEATNDIVIGGLDYGGDLRGWLTHVPYDSQGKIWADSHSYPTGDYKCYGPDGGPCWDRTLLPAIGEGFGAMMGEAGNSISRGGCDADQLKYAYKWAANWGDENQSFPILQWAFVPGGYEGDNNNTPTSNSCRIPSIITRWPGQTDESVAAGEAAKVASDPSESINQHWDDGTWAGCLNYAYLNDLVAPNSWESIPKTDPGSPKGNCSGYFGPPTQ